MTRSNDEPWVRWHWPADRTQYINHYNEQPLNSAGFAVGQAGPNHPNEVLGQQNFGSVSIERHEHFPKDTQFRIHFQFKWKIYGRGDEGTAIVFYGLKAKPFILIESCSYQYPESVCIDLDSYLP